MPFGRRAFLRTIGVGSGAFVLDPRHASALIAAPRPGRTSRRPGYTPSGTIDVWVHESQPTNGILQEHFDRYMSEYPDVTINLLGIPYADFETKSLTSTAAGEGPGLIKISGWSLPDWADKGLLVPFEPALGGFADEDAMFGAFADGVFEAVSYDDQAFALPVDYQNLMLFYNKDHFAEVGLDPEAPPTTWEEVVEAGEALTVRNGDVVERAGFQWWFNVPIWVYLEIESLVAQLGGTVLNEDQTEGALSSEAGIQALTYYLDMSNTHRIASLEVNSAGVLNAMAGGTASMFVSGAFTGPALAAISEGAITEGSDGNLGAVAMPVWADAAADVTAAYSWGWGITSNAEDPELAGHIAAFMTQPEQSNELFTGAGVGAPYSDFGESEALQASPANQIMVEQVPKSVYGPRIPQFVNMMTVLGEQIEAGATGQKSAEQIASDFDGAMRRVLR